MIINVSYYIVNFWQHRHFEMKDYKPVKCQERKMQQCRHVAVSLPRAARKERSNEAHYIQSLVNEFLRLSIDTIIHGG